MSQSRSNYVSLSTPQSSTSLAFTQALPTSPRTSCPSAPHERTRLWCQWRGAIRYVDQPQFGAPGTQLPSAKCFPVFGDFSATTCTPWESWICCIRHRSCPCAASVVHGIRKPWEKEQIGPAEHESPVGNEVFALRLGRRPSKRLGIARQ